MGQWEALAPQSVETRPVSCPTVKGGSWAGGRSLTATPTPTGHLALRIPSPSLGRGLSPVRGLCHMALAVDWDQGF